ERDELPYGLGGADSVRFFEPNGTTLIDSYSWTSHAGVTYGRCPDGLGAFQDTETSTKGAANICAGHVDVLPWPGSNTVTPADASGTFGSDMSGLFFDSAVA